MPPVPPPRGRRMRRASAVATPGASRANVAPQALAQYDPDPETMMMMMDTSQSTSSHDQSSQSTALEPPAPPPRQHPKNNKGPPMSGRAPAGGAPADPSNFKIDSIMGNVQVDTPSHITKPHATGAALSGPPSNPATGAHFNLDAITGTIPPPKTRLPDNTRAPTRNLASAHVVDHNNDIVVSDFDIDESTGSIASLNAPRKIPVKNLPKAATSPGMDFDVDRIMGNVGPATTKHPKARSDAGSGTGTNVGPDPGDLGALLGNVTRRGRPTAKDGDAETVISRVTGYDIDAIAGNIGKSPASSVASPPPPSSRKDQGVVLNSVASDGQAPRIMSQTVAATVTQPTRTSEEGVQNYQLPTSAASKWNRYRIYEPSAAGANTSNNTSSAATERPSAAAAAALEALDVVEWYQSKDDVDLLLGGTISPAGSGASGGSGQEIYNNQAPVVATSMGPPNKKSVPSHEGVSSERSHSKWEKYGRNGVESGGSGPIEGTQPLGNPPTGSQPRPDDNNNKIGSDARANVPITDSFSLDNATARPAHGGPTQRSDSKMTKPAQLVSFNLDAVRDNVSHGSSIPPKALSLPGSKVANGDATHAPPSKPKSSTKSGVKTGNRRNGPPAPLTRKAPVPMPNESYDRKSGNRNTVPAAADPVSNLSAKTDGRMQPNPSDGFAHETNGSDLSHVKTRFKVEPLRTSLNDGADNHGSSSFHRGKGSDSGFSSDNDYELSGSDRSIGMPKPRRLKASDKVQSITPDERLAALTSPNNEDSTEFGHFLRVAGRAVAKFVKFRVLMLNDEPDKDDRSEPFQNRSPDLMAQKISRRPLSAEQKELLRCIGLDAFMTLRFLKFGFDISFWPMVLAVFTIIPVYNTAGNGVVGFFSTTVVALQSNQVWRYWIACVFGIIYYLYILRRLWIEWELFLPLRYDFLENGDFQKEKYKEQFRKTCLIEYVPRAFKQDERLKAFFEAVFPGEVKRAEVLLNTEHLRSLIEQRRHHIVSYEDTYAYKVHLRATYLRDLEAYQNSGPVRRCCRVTGMPRPPAEPTIVVQVEVPRQRVSTFLGFSFHRDTTAKEPRTLDALKYHFEQIQRLNKEVDAEYLRLAKEQRRPVSQAKESTFSKWLGLKYLFSSDTGRLHSSTAFVEFKSLATKQEAIQCNITGTNKFMVVKPVPEVRDIQWDNIHISLRVIETRKIWLNCLLFGGLILWAFIVSLIRGYKQISTIVNITGNLAIFVNFYAPALIVEGLTRVIPIIIKIGCQWIRFKTISEGDHYLLRWYFAYRLLTFIFIIVAGTGGSLLVQGQSGVKNPLGFIRRVSGNVAENSQFFFSYVIVVGGIQLFLRLSQTHNLFIFWFIQKVKTEEAMSQRSLNKLKSDLKAFHLDEFIPLFIFIFMVAALYGTIAPLSGLFVAGFYRIAFKVFKFMCLYIYGNRYESGGQIFYTMSTILCYVLYMLIIFLAGFWSLQVSNAMSTVFSLLLIVTFVVQRDVDNTFVEPSRTLSLTKARGFDDSHDRRTRAEKKRDAYLEAKGTWEAHERKRREGIESGSDEDENITSTKRLLRRLVPRTESGDLSTDSLDESRPLFNRRKGRKKSSANESEESALARFEQRYQADNVDADGMLILGDESNEMKNDSENDFFIYRQPTLNRATWETAPLPYRDNLEREEVAEVWGDVRPEETRRVGRARRGSIAAMFG